MHLPPIFLTVALCAVHFTAQSYWALTGVLPAAVALQHLHKGFQQCTTPHKASGEAAAALHSVMAVDWPTNPSWQGKQARAGGGWNGMRRSEWSSNGGRKEGSLGLERGRVQQWPPKSNPFPGPDPHGPAPTISLTPVQVDPSVPQRLICRQGNKCSIIHRRPSGLPHPQNEEQAILVQMHWQMESTIALLTYKQGDCYYLSYCDSLFQAMRNPYC